METYYKCYAKGKGIAIAFEVESETDLFSVYGKGWSDVLHRNELELFTNSKRTVSDEKAKQLINLFSGNKEVPLER